MRVCRRTSLSLKKGSIARRGERLATGDIRTPDPPLEGEALTNFSIPVEELMRGMEELLDAGNIRFIEVSNFSVRDPVNVQAALSRQRIAANQVRNSLIERTIEGGGPGILPEEGNSGYFVQPACDGSRE